MYVDGERDCKACCVDCCCCEPDELSETLLEEDRLRLRLPVIQAVSKHL